MELYLVRYGDHTKSNPRLKYRLSLTEQGKAEIKYLVTTIIKSHLDNPVIFSSPVSYCYETAKIIQDQLRKKSKINKNILQTSDYLLPENNRIEFYKILSSLKFNSSVIIIGHEPYLTGVIIDAISVDSLNHHSFHKPLLKKSGLAKLVIQSLSPKIKGELKWLLTPRILKMVNKPSAKSETNQIYQ